MHSSVLTKTTNGEDRKLLPSVEGSRETQSCPTEASGL